MLNRWTLIVAAAILYAAPAHADGPIPGDVGAFEQDYLQFILDHHWSALRSTELAAGSDVVGRTINPFPGSPLEFPPTPAKGTNEVVLDIAISGNQAQEAEIFEGHSFLQDWYGVSATLELPASGAELIEMLEDAGAGDPFNIAFLTNFSMHHIPAIARSLECVERAGHAELVEYCQNIVTAQTREVIRMREELASEYGIIIDDPIPGQVPEPAAWALVGLGITCTACLRRRKASKA